MFFFHGDFNAAGHAPLGESMWTGMLFIDYCMLGINVTYIFVSQRAGAYVNENTVDQDSPSGYGPMISANRLLRTRMAGGVGAGGENPPATRLEYFACKTQPVKYVGLTSSVFP